MTPHEAELDDTVPPPPALPSEVIVWDDTSRPPTDFRIAHLEATIGELIDLARAQSETIARTSDALTRVQAVLETIGSRQLEIHEAVRALPCRADGLGCIARKILPLVVSPPAARGSGDE